MFLFFALEKSFLKISIILLSYLNFNEDSCRFPIVSNVFTGIVRVNPCTGYESREQLLETDKLTSFFVNFIIVLTSSTT